MQNGAQSKGKLAKTTTSEEKDTPEKIVPLGDILKYSVEKTGSVLEDYFSDPKLQGDKRFRPSLVINKQISDVYVDSYNSYVKYQKRLKDKNIMSFPQYMMKKELMDIAIEHGADLGATETTMMWPSLNEDGTISLYDFEKIDNIIWKKGRKAQQLSDLGLGSEEDLNTQFGQQFYNHTVAYNDRVRRYVAEMFNEGKFLKKDIIDGLTKRGLGYPKYLDIDFGKDISFMQNQLENLHKANLDKVQEELAKNMQAKADQQKAANKLSVEKTYYDKKLWEDQDSNNPANYSPGNTNLNIPTIEEQMKENTQWLADNRTYIGSPGVSRLPETDAEYEEAGYMKVGDNWVTADQFLQATAQLENKRIADVKKTLKDNPYAVLGFAQNEDELKFLRDLIRMPGAWKERELTNKERNILRDNQNIKGFFEFVINENEDGTIDFRSTEEFLKLMKDPEALYNLGLQLNPSSEDMTSVSLREQRRSLTYQINKAKENKDYDTLEELRQVKNELDELTAQDKIDNPNYYKNITGIAEFPMYGHHTIGKDGLTYIYNPNSDNEDFYESDNSMYSPYYTPYWATQPASGWAPQVYPELLFIGGPQKSAAGLGFKAATSLTKRSLNFLSKPLLNIGTKLPGVSGAVTRGLLTPGNWFLPEMATHAVKEDIPNLYQSIKDKDALGITKNAALTLFNTAPFLGTAKNIAVGGNKLISTPYNIANKSNTITSLSFPSLLQSATLGKLGKPSRFDVMPIQQGRSFNRGSFLQKTYQPKFDINNVDLVPINQKTTGFLNTLGNFNINRFNITPAKPRLDFTKSNTTLKKLGKYQSKGEVVVKGTEAVIEGGKKIVPYVTETINALSKGGKYAGQASRVAKTVGGMQYINEGLLNAGIDVANKEAVQNYIITEFSKPEFKDIDFTEFVNKDSQVKGQLKSNANIKIEPQEETVPLYRVQPFKFNLFQGANNYTKSAFGNPYPDLGHFQLDLPYRGDFSLFPRKRSNFLEFSEYPMDGSAVSGSDYIRPIYSDYINFGNYFARPKTLDFPEGYSTIPSLIEAPGLSVNPWQNEIVKIEVPKLHIESYRGNSRLGSQDPNIDPMYGTIIKKDKFGRNIEIPNDAINPGEYVVPFWNKYFTEARQIPDPEKDPEGYKKLMDNPFFSFGIHALTGYGAASQQEETEDKIKAGLLGSFGLKKVSPSTIKFFSRMTGTAKSGAKAAYDVTYGVSTIVSNLLTSKESFKLRRTLSKIEKELKPLTKETDDFYEFLTSSDLGRQIIKNIDNLTGGKYNYPLDWESKASQGTVLWDQIRKQRDLFGSSNIYSPESILDPSEYFTNDEIAQLGGYDKVMRGLEALVGSTGKIKDYEKLSDLTEEGYFAEELIPKKIKKKRGSSLTSGSSFEEMGAMSGFPLWALKKLGITKDISKQTTPIVFIPTKEFFSELKSNIKELQKAIKSDEIAVKDLSFSGRDKSGTSTFLLKNKVSEGLLKLEGFNLTRNIYDFEKTFNTLIDDKLKKVEELRKRAKVKPKAIKGKPGGHSQTSFEKAFESNKFYDAYEKDLETIRKNAVELKEKIRKDLNITQAFNESTATFKDEYGNATDKDTILTNRFKELNKLIAEETELISSKLERVINHYEGGISRKELGKFKNIDGNVVAQDPSIGSLYKDVNIDPKATFKIGEQGVWDMAKGEYVNIKLEAPSGSVEYKLNPETNKLVRTTIDKSTYKTADDLKLLEVNTSNINLLNNETGAMVYGSSLYPELGISSFSGDLDAIITDVDFAKNVIGNPNFVERGYGIGGWENMSDAQTFKYGNTEIDLNIIHTRKGADGKLYLDPKLSRSGERSLEIELIKQFFPDEWKAAQDKFLQKALKNKEDLPYGSQGIMGKALELDLNISLDEFNKRFDPQVKTVIDAYYNTKDKGLARIDELIMMGDSEKIAKGQQAFLNSIGGSGVFKLKTYDKSVFKDKEKNLELLNAMGYNLRSQSMYKDAINSPEKMNLLVNDYILNNSILSRYITLDLNKQKSLKDVYSAMGVEGWNPAITNRGGSAWGFGVNTTTLGDPNFGGNIFGNIVLNNNKLNKMNDPFETVKFLRERRDGNKELTNAEVDLAYKALADAFKPYIGDTSVEEFATILKDNSQKPKRMGELLLQKFPEQFIMNTNVTTTYPKMLDAAISSGGNPLVKDNFLTLWKTFAENVSKAFDTKAITGKHYGKSMYAALIKNLDITKPIKIPNQNEIELAEDLVVLGMLGHIEAAQSSWQRSQKLITEEARAAEEGTPMEMFEVASQLNPLNKANVQRLQQKRLGYSYTIKPEDIPNEELVGAFNYLQQNLKNSSRKTLEMLKPYEDAIAKLLNVERVNFENPESLEKIIEEITTLEAKTIQLEETTKKVLNNVKPHLANLVKIREKEEKFSQVIDDYDRVITYIVLGGGAAAVLGGTGYGVFNYQDKKRKKIKRQGQEYQQGLEKIIKDPLEIEQFKKDLRKATSWYGGKRRGVESEIMGNTSKAKLKTYIDKYPELLDLPGVRRQLYGEDEDDQDRKDYFKFAEGGQFIEMELDEDELQKMIEGGYRIEEID